MEWVNKNKVYSAKIYQNQQTKFALNKQKQHIYYPLSARPILQ